MVKKRVNMSYFTVQLLHKGKGTLTLRKKYVWGSGRIAPRMLNLNTRWRWVVSFTPRPLYPRGKRFRYLPDRRLGKPQSRSGRGGDSCIRPGEWTAEYLHHHHDV